jgi:uncharacterized membrane protein required for colicin V production
MTWLDVLCGIFLLLGGAGGYAQGFIRSSLRLLALLLGGILGMLFMLRLGSAGTTQGAVLRAAGAMVLGLAVTSLAAWSADKAVPHFVHRSLTNKILGILPGMLIGLLILTIGLGLADRLALSAATQEFLRRGVVAGPLVAAGDLVEQMVVGVR